MTCPQTEAEMVAALRASIAREATKRGQRLTVVHEHDAGDDGSCAECVRACRLSESDRALFARELAAAEALSGCCASANDTGDA